LGLFLASALALIFTIDRSLNNIWRVKRRRQVAQRVLIYWAAITLGPLILAASLTIAPYLISVSKTWVSGVPGGLKCFCHRTHTAFMNRYCLGDCFVGRGSIGLFT
jgi:membrane protein